MVYLFVYWCWDNIGACFNKTTRGCVIVLDPTQNLTMEISRSMILNDVMTDPIFWGNNESIEPNIVVSDLHGNIFSDMHINACWKDALIQ